MNRERSHRGRQPPGRRVYWPRLVLEPLEARTLPSFSSLIQFATGPSPNSVAAADLTGDGRLDLVTANSNGTLSVPMDQPPEAAAADQVLAADPSGHRRWAFGLADPEGVFQETGLEDLLFLVSPEVGVGVALNFLIL